MAELKRVLNYPTLLLIAINSIMGTGIYFLVGAGAKHAGPASLISWVIMSIIALYVASCFGELSGMFPKAGGVYEYAKQTYGRFPSFLVGWLAFMSGNITIAMLIVGGIQYLLPFNAPFMKIGICIMFLLLFNFMAFRGMKTSAIMLISFAVITIGTLFFVVLWGLPKVIISNFVPFFPLGKSTIFITIFFIMETFFGWESAVNLAEETTNPEKVIPKALVIGTAIIAVLSILLAVVSIGTQGYAVAAASSAPISTLGEFYFGQTGGDVFTLLIYVAIVGAVAGWVVSAPRLILALANDKLFLSQFAKIHPKYNTPYKAIIFQATVSILLVIIGSGSYSALLALLIPMALIMYALVLLSVVIQRFKNPTLPRPFKAPFGKIGPLFVVGIFAGLLAIWLRIEHGAINVLNLGLSLVTLGIPLYFLIGIYYDPKMIASANDITSRLMLLTESINFPKKVRKKILDVIGDIRGKTIVEYGCNVGTLTKILANEAGPEGKVYALDISKNDLRITRKRIDRLVWESTKLKHARVLILHDVNQIHRVPREIGYADVVVSVGMLSYLQDVERILTGFNKILPNDGRICFVEYSDFFKIIPNVEWLDDNRGIERIFREHGFSVQVHREKGLFWNYIYVYGMKSEKDVAFV
ncbi:amino acid permease [Candidatus Woesearchaeota archaeon]|nr:amino acid permease [Candidatus Woesearchaeota archaeon]